MDLLIENLPEWVPQFLWASLQTLQLTLAAFVLAVLIGIAVALLRRTRVAPIRWAMVAFVEVGRGTPALVILFLIYFALPDLLPALSLDSFTAAALGLGLQGGAVLSEIFRAGIDAIDRGQREAGISLGLTPGQTMVDVVAPQAIRVVLPPVGNYAIGLLKDTSIASTIIVPEMVFQSQSFSRQHPTVEGILPYVYAGVLYIVLSLPVAYLARRLDRRLREAIL